jgi:hypothetical protein
MGSTLKIPVFKILIISIVSLKVFKMQNFNFVALKGTSETERTFSEDSLHPANLATHGGSTGTKFVTSGKKSKIEISQKKIFLIR